VTIDLRLALPGDDEFLFSVYASTRAAEMDLVEWDVAQKQEFLRMQLRAQDQYYKENYPGALYQIILCDGEPAGRLYIHRRQDEIRIMDIALLPPWQKRGIASHLLNEILKDADENNLPVTIHVERLNPALHLYERLGFRLAEDKGVYYFMKRLPLKESYETFGSIAK
jgi:ribosomal protein S18 acetylase RimI-like enzyme